METRPTAGFLLSLTAAFLWGVLPIALKELLAGLDAVTMSWFRFMVAGAVMLVWLSTRSSTPLRELFTSSNTMRLILFISAMGFCSNYFLFSYGLHYVNAETSEAVIQLTTLFLIIGGVVFYKERFLAIQKLGTLLIMAGMILFFHDRLVVIVTFDSLETIGVILILISAIAWTIYALLQKKLLRHFNAMQILTLTYLSSFVVTIPFASPSQLLNLTTTQWLLLGFSCLNTLLGYGCFTRALYCWEASKVSATLALAPLFTIISLELIVWIYPAYPFSDQLTLLAIAGAILLVLGSILTALVPVLSSRDRRARQLRRSRQLRHSR
ncbi:MAG: DMT family transporter [Pseudohongiellaceae bacterium]